jgi:predicted transcriptional regulator
MTNPKTIDINELLETIHRLGASSSDELALRTGYTEAEITPTLDGMVNRRMLKQRRIKGMNRETVVYLPGATGISVDKQ